MPRLKRFRDGVHRIRAKIDSKIGPRSLFRHFDFLKLWSAETFSVFGVQFSGLAIPWIAAVGGSLAFLWVLLSPVRQIVKMPKRNGQTA